MGREITLTNGEKRTWQRAPKFVLWRHGQIVALFYSRLEEIAEGTPKQSFEARGQAFLASMTDDEGEKFEAMQDDIVRHSFGKPWLASADLVKPVDYMNAIGWTFYTLPEAPVETTEGETTVEAVENFRGGAALPAGSKNVSDVSGTNLKKNGLTGPVVSKRRRQARRRALEA